MKGADGQALPRLSAAAYGIQTRELFVTAYRELNARKLFWVALALNVIVILAMAAVGLHESGFSVLGVDLQSAFINSRSFSREDFYKFMIERLGVGIWLAWISTILALLSAASMFPDLASGGVDTMLSKPIGRTRLFLTTFACGLVFSTLQVMSFCLMAFFLLGIRAGVWEPGVFVVVPLVVAIFSYLFCVQAVIGFVTRSAVASVIVTLLFWIFVWIVDLGETVSLYQRTSYRLEYETAQRQVSQAQGEAGRESARRILAAIEDDLRPWALTHDILFAMKTVLPKTAETAQLTRRAIALSAGIGDPSKPEEEIQSNDGGLLMRARTNPRRVNAEFRRVREERTVSWVVGSSLIFEIVVVGVGVWYFRRRDF